MDLAVDYAYHLWDGYLYYFDRADPRVAEWPLMQAYWPTLLLTALYLFMVCAGTRFMRDRDPLPCYWLMLSYNVSLMALNVHICYQLFTTSRRLGYRWSCQPVDYSDNPDELKIAKALWWYYISKLIEFLDTMLFIARKKNNQVTFLHVYHHATMFPLWWIGIKWVPGGQSVFGAIINSFIHIIMYLYYCLSALGPSVQKYLWWKKYLTILQLVQFVVGMSHAAQSLYIGCPFPLWMHWALIIYGISIFALFINFYLHAYVKPRKRRTSCDRNSKIKKFEEERATMECTNGKLKNGSRFQNNTRISNGNVGRRIQHENNSHVPHHVERAKSS